MRALLALFLCFLLTYDTLAARASLPWFAMALSIGAIVVLFLYAALEANGAFDVRGESRRRCAECLFRTGHNLGCSQRGA